MARLSSANEKAPTFQEILIREGRPYSGTGQGGPTVPPSGARFTASIATTTLTVTAVEYGTIEVGQVLSASSWNPLVGVVPTPVTITALGTGTGGTGTYTISSSQTLGSTTVTSVGNIPAGGTVITGSTTLPQIGHALYVEEVEASLNQPCVARVLVTADAGGSGKFSTWNVEFVATPGVPHRWPFKGLFRGFQLSNNSTFSLNVMRMLSSAPGSDAVYGGVSAFGTRLTDDFDWNAPKVAMFVGDSLFEGTGPTKTDAMWPFIFKRHLSSLGTRARVVLRGVSGSNSNDVEGWRVAGFYDIAKVDLCFYSSGVNDAATAMSDATFVANITAFWTWFSKRYPTATMVVTGCTPVENNTWETRAVALRLAAAAYVASVNNPKLKFIDLGGSFDRLTSTNYAASDTPGSRVHPNDAGSAGVGTTVNAGWDALGITI